MAEFAFDITLYSCARVEAANREEALKKLHDVVDCIDISYNQGGVKLTEASLAADSTPELFEVDGHEPAEPGKQLWDNHYECPCGEEWTDRWSACCDDDCPTCGTTCSPSSSEEVEVEDA